MEADRSFCMPACFPRRNEAIVPGWVGLSAMRCPLKRGVAVARCNLGIHDIRSEDWEFGRWTDCGLPSCVWWGRWALDLHTIEGSLELSLSP